MKLKLFTIVTLSLLILTGSSFLTAAPVPPQQPNGVVVAVIDSTTGDITIRQNILKKKFKNGGDITLFQVKFFDDGFNLLRIGNNPNGDSRTEAVQLVRIGNQLKFYPVTWFVVCQMAGCWFCSPNAQKTECLCPDGSNCNFGIDVSGMGYDDIVVII